MPKRSRRRGDRPRPPVAWRDGVQLGATVVWCDTGRARDLGFISHAHLRIRGGHRKILATASTLSLLRAVGGGPAGEVLTAPFGRPFSLGKLRLELFPSGHVPGAASLLLIDGDGRRLVYAGDVNPERSLAEPMEVRGADVVVLEAPLAALERDLPPREEAREELREAVAGALEAGRTPVVLAPALGAAQEAMAVLDGLGSPIRAHSRALSYAHACSQLGLSMPAAARFSGRVAAGETLLWPLDLAASPALNRIGPIRRIRLAATADPRSPEEVCVPLVDHADRAGIVRYVLDSGAREAFFTAGFNPALAATLALHGVRAHPLGPPRQMDLFG